MVSSTTLKRFWGYVASDYKVSVHTLDVLARFLGYMGWKDFISRHTADDTSQSDKVTSRHLNVRDELHPGDCLRLNWLPDRVCDIRYLGACRFEVVRSEQTRLIKGNTFECGMIIENEPLYIDRLIQDDNPPVAYVCGKKNGVRFSLIS